jgi:hypothetical protein
MTMADATVPNMHETRLIHHVYRAPAFNSWEDVQARVRSDAVIYHTVKHPGFIDLLFANRGLPAPAAPMRKEPTPKEPAIMIGPKTDIFIKTYPKDYPWLEYCLRSIVKFASGFRRVIVISPDTNFGFEIPRGIEVQLVQDREPGYLWQQAVKLRADAYTDADEILFMDSDCIFTEQVSPETFKRGDKVLWMMTPWSEVTDQNAREQWLPSMTRFLGHVPAYEFMRRHPFLFPRWLFDELRKFCDFMHGMDLDKYIMNSGAFSEFNSAGGYAFSAHNDKFVWMDTSKEASPPVVVMQHWSHGGLDDAAKGKMDLALDPIVSPRTAEILLREPIKNPHLVSGGIEFPADAIYNLTIAGAIEFLSSESKKSNIAKARIVKSLRAAKVIK